MTKMLAACRRESHVGFYARPGAMTKMLAACRRESHVGCYLGSSRGAAANLATSLSCLRRDERETPAGKRRASGETAKAMVVPNRIGSVPILDHPFAESNNDVKQD